MGGHLSSMSFLKTSGYCFIIFVAISCGKEQRYTYTLSDFPPKYRQLLVSVLNAGIAGSDSAENVIRAKFSDKLLRKLSASEHPILRVVALRELLNRNSIDHQSLILSHLSDTAWVCIDMGEWGYTLRYVSDDLLDHASWKTEKEKEVVVKKVITEHKYLRSAYNILMRMEPDEEYYLHIKDMIEHDRVFLDLEFAAYALAKFKRKEDIPVIRDLLIKNYYDMGEQSFLLMQNYPDAAYLEVLKKFARRVLKRKVCEDPNSYQVRLFIETVATYKNDMAARILSDIANRKPFLNCLDGDNRYLRHEFIDAISNNPCPAFAALSRRFRDEITDTRKNTITLDVSPAPAIQGEPIYHW